jgi:hypothetical protein
MVWLLLSVAQAVYRTAGSIRYGIYNGPDAQAGRGGLDSFRGELDQLRGGM